MFTNAFLSTEIFGELNNSIHKNRMKRLKCMVLLSFADPECFGAKIEMHCHFSFYGPILDGKIDTSKKDR